MEENKLVPIKKKLVKVTKKRKKKATIIPNKFLYGMGNFAANIMNQQSGGAEFVIDPNFKKDDPFILLCNHLSHKDFMIAVAAVYPRRLNFVVSSYYFGKKLHGTVLRLICAIPKLQFQSDPTAVKRMLSVVKSGGAVAIYPEGQVCIDGSGSYIIPGIAKLVKAMRVDVVAGIVKGTYLTNPKWGKNTRTGPVEYELKVIITKEELSELSDEEVYSRIIEGMRHSDPEWAISKGYRYVGKGLAEGLEGVLYYCPKCHSHYTMATKGNVLYCTSCGNSATIDPYGGLVQETTKDTVIPSVHLWREKQKSLLAKKAFEENQLLEMPVKLRICHGSSGEYAVAGTGILSCDFKNIYYRGTKFGEEVEQVFQWKNMMNFAYTPMDEMEIPSNRDIYAFSTPECPAAVEEWVELAEIFLENSQLRKSMCGEE